MKLIPDFWPEASAQPSTASAGDELEKSYSQDAQMNLLLRFETASGPRTVIACSVSRQAAADIAEVMRRNGQGAQFIDRCSPLSIADRVMIQNLH